MTRKNNMSIGITEFYKKVLPSKGTYCIATIDSSEKGRVKHYFVESIDEIEPKIEELKSENSNIYVTHSTFDGHSRLQDNAIYSKSFFVDLDVGEDKDYKTKDEALASLNKFLIDTGLPEPIIVDSGRGVWAWWAFQEDIPIEEWKLYADKFKKYCLDNDLKIDPSVTADKARITRAPNCFNYKTTPPSTTKVISDTIYQYPISVFVDILGELEIESSIESILNSVPKGISDDMRQMLKLDNFESSFHKIVMRSMTGSGCAQIKYILENAKTLAEPIWRAGLSIAQHCSDGAQAIHMMSEDHPGYTPEATLAKALATQDKPQSCQTFNELNPKVCEGCQHRGKITNPLALGREFQIAKAPTENTELATVEGTTLKTTRPIFVLPDEMFPFVTGKQGGIYYMPPSTSIDQNGAEVPANPVLVCSQDLYPLKRIYSPTDGECLLMRAILPNDPDREFLMPMKYVYAQDRFKEVMSSIGIFFNPTGANLLVNYIIKWGQYLMNKNTAEIMRTQMGWTPDRQSFVIGEKELTRDGKTFSAPTSPLCRSISKHLTTNGSYDLWKESANKLNKDSLEIHAFVLLAGFGSPLMSYTSTSGVTISLTGESGAAKTGALYSALSIWGNPKDLSVLEATENGMTGRYLGLHNLPFGLDEVGNMNPIVLSQLIHRISQGKSKIRMQASVNAEREHEMSASLIGIFTSNHSLYDKLTTLKKDPNGEVARLIEISTRKPNAFKDDADLGREIFDKFRFNYGWAGHDFIFNLYKYTDTEISDMMNKWILRFKKDFGDDTAYRFYENLIAVAFTAGEICNKAGIVTFDLDRIYRKIVGEMINIRDNVVKVNHIDYESLIGEFLNTNQTGILAIKDGKVSMEPRSSLVIRAEVDTSTIFIAKPAFRKFLSDAHISSREFLFQMQSSGNEVKEIKKRMGTGWKDATGAVNAQAYVFDTTKFTKDIFKGLDESTGT